MTARLRICFLVLLLSAVLAASASATKVNVKYAEADYSSWKTWTFAENAEQDAALEAAGRTETRAKVEAAIADRLSRLGYEKAKEGQDPDFRVSIDGSLREAFDVEGYHTQISDHVAFVMEGGSSSYQEGTLMIRLLEGASGEVKWTGWVVEKIDNPKKTDAQIRKVVKKILRKFPPR